ncbi:heavy metal RND efflux outer membrane protein, CzcC family [Hydrogenimonas sp.]|nr:heavy metal RND efflux outer membrane protein, CzcC family [Hydrogenimonas sp.]
MSRVFIVMLTAISLFGADYREFEKRALQSSPEIASARLQSDASRVRGEILTRYENPEIEAEISSFSPDNGSRENGWRFGVSQSFRLFGLQDDLKEYAKSLELYAKTGYEKSRSGFIAALRRGYTDYVMALYTKELIEEEISISKRLESIARERFESGGGTKAALMQASLELQSAENRLLEAKRAVTERYYRLVAFAGITERIELDAQFLYSIPDRAEKESPLESPDLKLARTNERLLAAEAETQSRRVKSYNLFGEIEDEPDQSIGRIGIALDLPLFNRSNQEYRLAKIRAKQAALQRKRVEIGQRARLESLMRQVEILKKRYTALKEQERREKELLALFEEGYKMAQSSLLDLLRTKNSLIETEREILKTRYLTNLYKIETEYLKGNLK